MGCAHGKSTRSSSSLHSFDSLTVDEVAEVIRKSPELSSLARNCLDAVDGVRIHLTGLKAGFDKAVTKGDLLRNALSMFDHEKAEEEKGKAWKKRKRSKKSYVQTLAKLAEFKAEDEPFGAMDSDELRTACEKLRSMVQQLRKRKHELDRSLTSNKRWRKVWKAAYTVLVIAALVASVAFAVAVMPPAAVAGATAAATAMKAVEYWFDTIWDEKEERLNEEREAVKKMRKATFVEVQDVESARALAEEVAIGIGSVRNLVEFALGGEAEAVKLAMMEMRSKVVEVERGIRDLKLKVDACDAQVNRVAEEFMKAIN